MVLSLGYPFESPRTLFNMCMPITSPVQLKQHFWGRRHQNFIKVSPRVKPAGPLAGAPCPQSFSWAPRAWSLLAHTRAVVNISFLASPGSDVHWLCLHFAISPHLDCNLVQQSVPSSAGLLESQHRSQPWAGPWHTAQSRVEAGYLHTHRKFPNAVQRAYFLSTASYQGSIESIITKPYFHKLLLH